MKFLSFVSFFVISILGFCSSIHAQQPYEGKATTNCSNKDSSVLGYSCNGLRKSCQAYLTFRSVTPYNTVTSISNLLSSDPSELSAINGVSETATFDTNKLVIVPVNCSCSGNYYQASTSYIVQPDETPLLIANNTFQGLSNCQAVQEQNNKQTTNIFAGERLTIPLRCACPTKNQSDVGINYLLTYLVIWRDTVSDISARFRASGADTGRSLEANTPLSLTNPTIFPFTTLLIPLQNPPSSNQTIAPPPPPPSPPPPQSPNPSDSSSNKTWIYVLVGVLGGIVLTLAIGFIIFFVVFHKGRKGSDLDPIIVSESFEAIEKPENKKLDEEYAQDFLDSLSSIAQSIKVYKFKELEAATDNFSPSCWIKGSVYRGLINGDYASIKKVNGDVSKEIDLLNKVNHLNLIRLSGVCFSDGHWYLVYEYAANGPLSDWIYNTNNEEKFLNWTQRIQISLDVATGLNYLHSFTNPPHVHKDIKSSNVLLDSDFRAKIANLAMARSTEGQEGEFALTRHIIGTKGYMAPEYLENGLVSTKLDVYSFGVLMMEIVTGKEVAALYAEENMNLSDVLNDFLFKKDGKEETLMQFIDPSLQGNCPMELTVLILRMINSCLSKNPADRPPMDEITQFLTTILASSMNWESSFFSGYHHSRSS